MAPRHVTEIPHEQSVVIASRLAARCTEDAESGCWVWTGSLDRSGYGKIKINRVVTGTHRAAWLSYRGSLPDGLVIDHLCRTRACANPWHMEPVTVRVNTDRAVFGTSTGKPPGRPKGTRCSKGHPYAEHGTERKRSGGGMAQICLTCERSRARLAAKVQST